MDLIRLRNDFFDDPNLLAQHELEEVNILSPYLSKDFFEKLIKLKPQTVFITTDAGCSSSDIQEVEETLKQKFGGLRLAYCAGIVHAKCFLFRWRNIKSKITKTLLLWGSCNATEGGFGRNAEIYSWIPLIALGKESRQALLDYFGALKSKKSKTNQVQIKADKMVILLPEIRFTTPKESTFDIWVQKGRLCHPFQADPNFRHLKVTLLEKIAPNDNFSLALQQFNIGINQQTTISFDYLRHNSRAGTRTANQTTDDQYTSIWKSRYFIDTAYGFWTSEECYQARRHLFHRQDKKRRENEISRICHATQSDIKGWIDTFLDILNQIAYSTPNFKSYFYCSGEKIDEERYRKIFENQIERDMIRSIYPWFKQGYTSGYDFPEMPPMRDASSIWESFMDSASSSLYFEINKGNTRNWLAQTLKHHTDANTCEDGNKFLEWLRNNWREHEELIRVFHEREE